MNVTWTQDYKIVSFDLDLKEADLVRKIMGAQSLNDLKRYKLTEDEIMLFDSILYSFD